MTMDLPKDLGAQSQKRAQDQTTDEWALEHETGQEVRPAAWGVEPGSIRAVTVASVNKLARPQLEVKNPRHSTAIGSNVLLKYEIHKTTRQGRLNLVFRIVGTTDEAVAWFNVSTERKRVSKKPRPTKKGLKGYFYPEPRSNFRKFWEEVFGPPDIRWGAVYLRMGRLKSQTFTGELLHKIDSKGKPYIQVNNLRLVGGSDVSLVH